MGETDNFSDFNLILLPNEICCLMCPGAVDRVAPNY